MFNAMIEVLRANPRKIVFTEGHDARILDAAARLNEGKFLTPILIGNVEEVKANAAKGGFNHESHNHNDVGSFLAFYDNNPVLVDPGCGVYTKKTFSEHRYEIWTMQSGWHNLPVINGCEEPFGAEFKCNRFDVDGKKTVIDFEGAYDKNAGLKSVSRVIEPTDDSILLTDSFVFENASNTVAEHFVTHLDVRVEDGKVVIGDNFMLTTDTDCEILLDYVDFEGDKSLTSSWGTDKMNRIKFVYKTGDKATISIVLRRM